MKRMKKNFLALALALIMVFTALPVYATTAETPQGPVISKWALKTVNEGQLMGLVAFGAETMAKDYTKEITSEELKTLNENLSAKLETQNLKKNDSFKAVEVKDDSTRESVLLNLFNILGKYDLEVKADTNPIEYLVKNNILKGKGNDYGLQDKATFEEAVVLYSRAVTDFYDDYDLGGKGAFYKIENKGNTVYLFGSIHIGETSMYPLEAERMKAFNESDELHVELNLLDAETIAEVQKLQIRTDGKTLKDDLGEELYNRVKAIMDKVGVPEEMYSNLEPWTLINTLSILPLQLENPYGTYMGVDIYLLTNATLDGTSIYPFETPDLQMNILKEYYSSHDGDLVEEIEKLMDALEDEEYKEITEGFNKMMVSWRDGNIEEFSKIFEADESSKILLETRDPKMAEKIKEMLESEGEKTYFVLVGAGHYAPEGSVINYLEDYGFTVQDLNS